MIFWFSMQMCNVYALVIHGPKDRPTYEKRRKLALHNDKWDFVLEVYNLPILSHTSVKFQKNLRRKLWIAPLPLLQHLEPR